MSVGCSSCHVNGQFAGTPKLCWDCHRTDYESAGDPNHVTQRFDSDCALCHSDNAWVPATFDHSQTQFPLTGTHIRASCASCHPNGGFTGTPVECYGCHRADFERATDPNHLTAQFPHDCALCHTTNRWDPATFDHAGYFPIYSGSHRGEWDSCSDCHTQASDYNVFSCITCHEHSRSQVDREHQEVSGYSYNSDECYRCHPTGSEEGGGEGDD